jgi:hypothetical protein
LTRNAQSGSRITREDTTTSNGPLRSSTQQSPFTRANDFIDSEARAKRSSSKKIVPEFNLQKSTLLKIPSGAKRQSEETALDNADTRRAGSREGYNLLNMNKKEYLLE